ncbi:unnamed protein product [Arabis nemorensis]|uniref:DUF4219 domain-containing protein n=1 Tax=Arabis nemorensis TaxID=586526 RepID=A0A565BB79_9BRAS|nr:unnamed protein product [Arabis nemorensis]
MGRMISLDGSNYHIWKSKMEDLLYVKELYVPVFEEKKPEDKTEDQWKLLHRQMCGLMRQWVDDNVRNPIENEIDARSLWLKLEQLFARKTGNNKMDCSINYLIWELSLRMRFTEVFTMSFCNSALNGVISMDLVKNSVLNEEVGKSSPSFSR